MTKQKKEDYSRESSPLHIMKTKSNLITNLINV